MADETIIAGVTPAAAPATVPAGEAVTPPEPTPEAKPASLDEAVRELAELRAQVRRVNAENAERRRKLAAFEAAEVERKQADLSELEKLRVQVAEKDDLYQQSINELTKLRIRHAVEMAAGRLGFHKPEDAAQLMDWAEVTVDEDGKVRGVEEALKALLKDRPYLVRQQQAAPDLNAQQRGAGDKGVTKSREEELRKRFRL